MKLIVIDTGKLDQDYFDLDLLVCRLERERKGGEERGGVLKYSKTFC